MGKNTQQNVSDMGLNFAVLFTSTTVVVVKVLGHNELQVFTFAFFGQ